MQLWEGEIRDALHQADIVNAAALAPIKRSRVIAGGTLLGLPNILQTGRSVHELIEEQRTPVDTVPKCKKKAKRQEEAASAADGGQTAETQPETTRRHRRFLWNIESDH